MQVLSLDSLTVLPFQGTEAADFGSMDVWMRFTNSELQDRYALADATDALPSITARVAIAVVGE